MRKKNLGEVLCSHQARSWKGAALGGWKLTRQLMGKPGEKRFKKAAELAG